MILYFITVCFFGGFLKRKKIKMLLKFIFVNRLKYYNNIIAVLWINHTDIFEIYSVEN